ncbi:tRNA-i(6)A37 methylthiotransferase, partial [hydrothermal vent metagenome]
MSQQSSQSMPNIPPFTGGLYVITYGCQMNEYDSDKMASLLEKTHGLKLVTEPDEADVVLMNTCSVREKAQEKVFSEL